MNITICPHCGGHVRSISIGWKCENCQGFIDMRGQFHEHKEEPFMPPMTNADHIRAMSDEELARWICSIMTAECCDQRCPARDICNLGDNGLAKWMKQPAEEDT